MKNLFFEQYDKCNYYLLTNNLIELHFLYPLSKFQLEKTFSEDNLKTVLRPDLSYDPQVCPSLTLLSKKGDEISDVFRHEFIRQIELEYLWDQKYTNSIIKTSLTIAELAEYIIKIGTLIGSKTNGRYFPFYDPFILEFISIHNDNSLLNQSLEKEISFYYPSIELNKFNIYSSDEYDEVNSRSNDFTQLFNLERINEIKIIIYHLKKEYAYKKNNEKVHSKMIQTVSELWDKSIQLNILNKQDRRVYILNALSFNTDFFDNTYVMQMIKECTQNNKPISEGFLNVAEYIFS